MFIHLAAGSFLHMSGGSLHPEAMPLWGVTFGCQVPCHLLGDCLLLGSRTEVPCNCWDSIPRPVRPHWWSEGWWWGGQEGASQSGPAITLWWNTDSCPLWIRLRKWWWRLSNAEVMVDDRARMPIVCSREGSHLAITEEEAEEVGEAQHGLPVHAVVQVIPQQLLLQDHVIPEYVFLLDDTQKGTSAHRSTSPWALTGLPTGHDPSCISSHLQWQRNLNGRDLWLPEWFYHVPMFLKTPVPDWQCLLRGPPGTLLQHQSHQTNGPRPSQVWVTASLGPSIFLSFSCPDLFPFSQPLGL